MPTQQITNEDTETVNNPLLGLNPNDIESNLNYWNPRPIKKDNPYLTVQRKLSPQTVEDFANRLFIYQVGKNNHIGFPFRKPSQMEILNFEMRNYFAETNTNYKDFATVVTRHKAVGWPILFLLTRLQTYISLNPLLTQ